MFDVEITKNGDLASRAGFVKGERLLIQKIEARLNRWRGENLTDSNDGLPFLQWSDEATDKDVISAIIADYIEDTQGVISVKNRTTTIEPDRTFRFEADILIEDVETRQEVIQMRASIDPNAATLVATGAN